VCSFICSDIVQETTACIGKVALTPQGPLVVDSHDLLVQAARGGAGLPCAIEAAISYDLANGSLHRVTTPTSLFFFCWRSTRSLSVTSPSPEIVLKRPVVSARYAILQAVKTRKYWVPASKKTVRWWRRQATGATPICGKSGRPARACSTR
jgi:hypothetical protein